MKNELMLDTVNIEEIKSGIKSWPISGITSNPSILKKAGKINIYDRLKEIKELIGKDKTLHVQLVSSTAEEMIKEAEYILNKLGQDTYIKIPATNEGIAAIKKLKGNGVKITATGIYSAMQGIIAVMAGADYIAVYFNRMEDLGIDAGEVISSIRSFIEDGGYSASILAASFRNSGQVLKAYSCGAKGATVSYAIIKGALETPVIKNAVNVFKNDFEEINGIDKTMMDV